MEKIDWNDVATFVALVLAMVSVRIALKEFRTLSKQMKQLTDQQLVQLSNEHNWNLYDRHSELPLAIPAWKDLSDTGWAWRILHSNHLNLLWLAYKDYQRGFMNQDELQGWVRKAKYWFSNLRAESSDFDTKEGRETLRQLLEHEEGFSNEFRQ